MVVNVDEPAPHRPEMHAAVPRQAVKPPRLRRGDAIGVAALAGPPDPARLDAGLAYLRARGYRVVEASNARRRQGYLAGGDAERARGYHELLRNPEVRAIFLARGGYGSMRLFSHLDLDLIRTSPRIHLGASDATAHFAFLWNHAHLVTFYGPMPAVDFAREPVDEVTDSWWEPVLQGRDYPRAFSLARESVLRPGVGEGPLLGGCLSLLVALEGSAEAVDTEGCVFFWEDVGEELYRIDRMLTQWRRSGKFDGVRGVMIGKLTEVDREGARDEAAIMAFLRDFFADAAFPVVCDVPLGHGGSMLTAALGVPVRLDAEAAAVTFLEAGVA